MKQQNTPLIMHKNLRFSVWLILLFIGSSNITAEETDEKLRINATMTTIGNTITDLFPIFLNEVSFNNPENEATINEGVERIVSSIQSARAHFNQSSKPSQISYDVLNENLLEAQRAMKVGNKHYAQNLLSEVVSICTSCHTQDDKTRTLFQGKGREAFTSDFEYGEFNFLTRNYEAAIVYYDRYLTSPYALKPERLIFTSSKKLLTIYAQVLNDPGRGVAHFKKLVKNDRLTPLVEKNAKEWIKGLEELQANQASQVKEVTFGELDKYVHQYLGPLDSPGSAIVPTKKQKVYHL